MSVSRVHISSEVQTCTFNPCPTSPPGHRMGISAFSCPKLSSSSSSQPALLSSVPLVFDGDTVLLTQARSWESAPVPLSLTPLIQPIRSCWLYSRCTRTPACMHARIHTHTPAPAPCSTPLGYHRSQPVGLPGSLAASLPRNLFSAQQPE